MRLVDAYAVEGADSVLYELLAERPVENWISHERLPTFQEHQAFIASRPFLHWLLITIPTIDAESMSVGGAIHVGAIEVTDRNEIGIAILKRHRGHGYGRHALAQFVSEYQPLPAIPAIRNGRWLANIAVGNDQSERFFSNFGFKIIQKTMALPNG